MDERPGGPQATEAHKPPGAAGMGELIGIGAALGLIFGLLLDNLALGIACGAGLGAVAGAIESGRRRAQRAESAPQRAAGDDSLE